MWGGGGEGRGWRDLAKRKEDSWTRTTVWGLWGQGCKGAKWQWKKYNDKFKKKAIPFYYNPFLETSQSSFTLLSKFSNEDRKVIFQAKSGKR